ncbi:hypothetical protein [Pasteuria penetrans]|uniref:hypothetical protein n=1 Tax=Pasteuria penetrans TaxID=86005 RepID=UPI0011EDA7A0|nr:hypothetical protein [Pasteuria penetrans]
MRDYIRFIPFMHRMPPGQQVVRPPWLRSKDRFRYPCFDINCAFRCFPPMVRFTNLPDSHLKGFFRPAFSQNAHHHCSLQQQHWVV